MIESWPAGGRIPRYKRASRSHVFFTRDWHLCLYRGQRTSRGTQTGVTVKRRRRDGSWAHYMLRAMRYETRERGCGQIRHYELSRHLSAHAKSSGNRVPLSKRYLRFKVCL